MVVFVLAAPLPWIEYSLPVVMDFSGRLALAFDWAVFLWNSVASMIAYGSIGLFILMFVAMFAWPFVWVRQRQVVRVSAGESVLGWCVVVGLGLALAAAAHFGIGELPLRKTLQADIGNALLFAALTSVLMFRRHRHHNVEDRRYELCAELLSTLARDSDPLSEIALRLDLGLSTVASKQTDRKTYKNRRGRFYVRVYTDSWLDLRGRLLDGTRYHVSCTDVVKAKRVVKGRKNKTKQKSKSKQKVAIQLKVKPSKAPGLAHLGNAARQALAIAPISINSVAVAVDGIAVKASFAQSVARGRSGAERQGHASRMLLMGMFQVIGFAKRRRKRAR